MPDVVNPGAGPATAPGGAVFDLIAGAAQYLVDTRHCAEDRVAHNGRRAYVWPMLRWLDSIDEKGPWKDNAVAVAADLFPQLKENPEGAVVIHPGLLAPTNFSTNAIDTGIFVDSAFDYFALNGGAEVNWSACVEGAAHSYNAKKIAGPREIQDQILWCATGLARWVNANTTHHSANEYRVLLEDVVDAWTQLHGADGSAPYTIAADSPWLHGQTTYYHSRCVAFAWYVLEAAGIDRPDLIEKLQRSARFLARMIGPDGRKNLCLDAKRYYFWGERESGSNPYDVFVFWKMHVLTGETFWREASGFALRDLIRDQKPSGAISNDRPDRTPDWQCDTMRTSHVAWLTRVPRAFLDDALADVPDRLEPPAWFFERIPDAACLAVGGNAGWVPFALRKTPLTGFAGHRQVGLIAARPAGIMDLGRPVALSYQHHALPRLGAPQLRYLITKSLKHALTHARYCLQDKRRPRQAFAFLKYEFFSYLWAALFHRRTEFACSLDRLEFAERLIRHKLVTCDAAGNAAQDIGERTITWDGDKMRVEDRLTTAMRLRINVPSSWTEDGSAHVRGHVTGPATLRFNVPLKDL